MDSGTRAVQQQPTLARQGGWVPILAADVSCTGKGRGLTTCEMQPLKRFLPARIPPTKSNKSELQLDLVTRPSSSSVAHCSSESGSCYSESSDGAAS
jgi:hypothetical protein